MKLIGFALADRRSPFRSIAAAQHEQHAAAGDKLGTVNFETSCQPATRADFNRGMALLHSFEFGPAIDSFNKVLGADPELRDRLLGHCVEPLEQSVRRHQGRAAARSWTARPRRRDWRRARRRRAKRRISPPSISSTPTRRPSRIAIARSRTRRRWRPCSASIATISKRVFSTRSRSIKRRCRPTRPTRCSCRRRKSSSRSGRSSRIIRASRTTSFIPSTFRCWRRRR